jgi:hypothetical protein
MHTITLSLTLAAGILLTACNHVEATHNRCGGTTACAKGPCDPFDVLSDRPNRPFQELGVVEVRVDRGTALKNVTIADAMPALVREGKSMGADAIILTHEEFTSWFDKGEPAAPIHDLERQESWYITEKARYVSGIAVAYTGVVPVACPPTGMPSAPVVRAVPPGSRTMECFIVGPDGRPTPAPCPSYGAPAPTYQAPTYQAPTYRPATGPSAPVMKVVPTLTSLPLFTVLSVEL